MNQDKDAELEEIIAFLPDKLEILEGLGMGPNGPPIPAPTEFSVVPYPNKRELLNQNSKHFEFIATGIGMGLTMLCSLDGPEWSGPWSVFFGPVRGPFSSVRSVVRIF